MPGPLDRESFSGPSGTGEVLVQSWLVPCKEGSTYLVYLPGPENQKMLGMDQKMLRHHFFHLQASKCYILGLLATV